MQWKHRQWQLYSDFTDHAQTTRKKLLASQLGKLMPLLMRNWSAHERHPTDFTGINVKPASCDNRQLWQHDHSNVKDECKEVRSFMITQFQIKGEGLLSLCYVWMSIFRFHWASTACLACPDRTPLLYWAQEGGELIFQLKLVSLVFHIDTNTCSLFLAKIIKSFPQ